VCLNIFITINLYVAETYKPSLFAYRPRFCRVRLTQLRHKRLIFFGCIIRLSLHNQNFWLSFLSGFIFLCFSITIKKRYVYFAYLWANLSGQKLRIDPEDSKIHMSSLSNFSACIIFWFT
jgi:hypothetical protein